MKFILLRVHERRIMNSNEMFLIIEVVVPGRSHIYFTRSYSL